MAEVIYRYGPIQGDVVCKGEPVHFGYHVDGQLYVWCRLLCEVENGDRYLRLVATGEPFIGPCFGSIVTQEGLVWHLVEWSDPYGED